MRVQRGTQTLRVSDGTAARGSGAHCMSSGHSEPLLLGVQRRRHEPPEAIAGAFTQVVSAQPGSSGQIAVHDCVQMPARHDRPALQSPSAPQ